MALSDRMRNYFSKTLGLNEGTIQDLEHKFYNSEPIDTSSIMAELESLDNRIGDMEPAAEAFPAAQEAISTLQTTVNNIPAPPAASTSSPISVAVDSAQGSSIQYARADHTHAARVQRKIVTLDTNGLATWTFTRPFTAEPSLQYMVFQASGEPIIVEAQSWVMTGANYTGVNIKAYRSRAMPTLTPLTVVTFVLTGVNALFAALSGFNIFGGTGLTGVKVHMSAGDQM